MAAFERVQFTDRFGRPIPRKLRDQLVRIFSAAITHPKADVDAVLHRAQVIAQGAADGKINDIQRYATKALFAVSRKETLKREREPISSRPPVVMQILAGPAVEGSESALEARVLVGELLAKLLPIEREVFLRYGEGWEHPEIAKELGISVTMSRFRLSQAKKKMVFWLQAER